MGRVWGNFLRTLSIWVAPSSSLEAVSELLPEEPRGHTSLSPEMVSLPHTWDHTRLVHANLCVSGIQPSVGTPAVSKGTLGSR